MSTVGLMASLWVTTISISTPVVADTVESALAQAYKNNQQLNIQRALLRATDEQVPIALSGYRPRVSATTTLGQQSLSTTQQLLPTPPGVPPPLFTNSGYNTPYSAGFTATQTIYNGNQTANRTRAAEGQVFAARETLRTTEQTVLLSAITAYTNLLRDFAILELNKRNVTVLAEQLRETRDRFKVGDVTATDISQSESRLAGGETQVLAAESNYKTSIAVYREVIGSAPGKLSPGSPVDRFCPKTLEAALGLVDQHPNVTTAVYNVDVAQWTVKIGEGQLLPTLSVQGNAQKNWNSQLGVLEAYSLSVVGQLSVPLYQGGAEYAAVRQAKETLGQRRIELDLARQQIRQGIVQAWSQLQATKAQIKSTEAQVKSTESALNGVREEARVGQRTTLDVLNAQQELVNARVALVTAQHDRIVASYTLLGTVGRLSAQVLGLPVNDYNPATHYHQVRDSWVGLRTPDGK